MKITITNQNLEMQYYRWKQSHQRKLKGKVWAIAEKESISFEEAMEDARRQRDLIEQNNHRRTA